MVKAYSSVQPDAQRDVPSDTVPGGAASDTAASRSEDGPVHGALARAVNDLRNASSAIGPVNYLPDSWPEADVAVLREATEIILRLVDANAAPS